MKKHEQGSGHAHQQRQTMFDKDDNTLSETLVTLVPAIVELIKLGVTVARALARK